MFGAILKVTNSSFQKGMTFCRSVYVKKVMKLLAFIFEQPSYIISPTLASVLGPFCDCQIIMSKKWVNLHNRITFYH